MHREQGTDLSHFTLRDVHDMQLRGTRCVERRVTAGLERCSILTRQGHRKGCKDGEEKEG